MPTGGLMRDRIKWTLIGLGFTFGLQIIISLLFSGISAPRNQLDIFLMIAYGLSLGAFLIGGFVIGWMSEELRVLDAVLVTVVALLLVLLGFAALPNGNRGPFVTGHFSTALTRRCH